MTPLQASPLVGEYGKNGGRNPNIMFDNKDVYFPPLAQLSNNRAHCNVQISIQKTSSTSNLKSQETRMCAQYSLYSF